MKKRTWNFYRERGKNCNLYFLANFRKKNVLKCFVVHSRFKRGVVYIQILPIVPEISMRKLSIDRPSIVFVNFVVDCFKIWLV